jgi:hypothetical protein
MKKCPQLIFIEATVARAIGQDSLEMPARKTEPVEERAPFTQTKHTAPGMPSNQQQGRTHKYVLE